MDEQVVILTEEQVAALADKLDRFGEELEADERRTLVALLSKGLEQAEAASADVAGFGFQPEAMVGLPIAIVPDPLRFAMLGDTIRLGGATHLGRFGNKTAYK